MDSRFRVPVLGLAIGLLLGGAFLTHETSRFYKCDSPHTTVASIAGERAAASAPAAEGGAKPNYVMAVSMGIKVEWLSIFVQSWKRWSPATKVVVFVDAETLKDPMTVALFKDFGVEAIEFELPEDFAIHVYRFHLYLGYLNLNDGAMGGVAVSDIKDVAVQGDPWAMPAVESLLEADALLFSLEGGTQLGNVSIKHDVFNRKWIRECFGEEMADKLGDNPISCSGVTLGSYGAMRAYMRKMLDVITNDVRADCTDISGADQGVHNYLLYELGPQGKLGFNYQAKPNLESTVHTVSLGFPVGLDMYGRLVRLQGGPMPTIVHQYNRHSELIAQYKAMYPITEGREITFQRVRGYVGERLPAEYNDYLLRVREEAAEAAAAAKASKSSRKSKDDEADRKRGI